MGKIIGWGIMALMLVGMVCGYYFNTVDYLENKDVLVSRVYEGRLYLEADEYEQFKQYLAGNPDVRIDKMEVLSSPNALVDVRLTAPADVAVPYGEVVYEQYGATKLDFIMGLFLITALGGLLTFFISLLISRLPSGREWSILI